MFKITMNVLSSRAYPLAQTSNLTPCRWKILGMPLDLRLIANLKVALYSGLFVSLTRPVLALGGSSYGRKARRRDRETTVGAEWRQGSVWTDRGVRELYFHISIHLGWVWYIIIDTTNNGDLSFIVSEFRAAPNKHRTHDAICRRNRQTTHNLEEVI